MNTNTNAIGMSFKKKALIALCAFVAVVAIVITSVMATVAYLTGSASVINSFTVGSVTIRLDETAVLPNGVKDTSKTERVQSNTYELVPDRVYKKDPTLHVLEGSTASYLFITVRNDLSRIANKSTTDEILTIAEQLRLHGWAEYKTSNIGTVYVYVGTATKDGVSYMPEVGVKVDPDATYISVQSDDPAEVITPGVVLSKNGDYPIFEYFSIDSSVKQEELTHYAAAKIIINAFAIQADGFDTVGEAWEQLEKDYSDVISGLGGNAQE